MLSKTRFYLSYIVGYKNSLFMMSEKIFNGSADRNKAPILETLKDVFSKYYFLCVKKSLLPTCYPYISNIFQKVHDKSQHFLVSSELLRRAPMGKASKL